MFRAQSLSDWISLFETLLPNILIDVQLTADEKGEEYVVVKPINPADLPKIEQTLQHSFHSPQTFRSHLPYEINDQPRAVNIPVKDIRQVPKPASTINEGRRIFINLFKRGISELSINIEELFNGGSAKDGVLYSKPSRRIRATTHLRATVEALVSYFTDATLDTIRDAFEGIASLPEPTVDADTNQGLVKGLVQQCFFVKETPEGQVIGFNFELLHSLLYPPTFAPPVVSAPELWLKTSHLVPYLGMLTQGDEKGGVLLRAVKDGQSQNAFLRPMLFYHQNTPKTSNYYKLILDCSGSMQNYLPALKIRVKEFIAQLRSVEPNAIVEIVPFSSVNTVLPAEFNIQHDTEIQFYIDQLVADGRTPLFDTLGRELEILAKKGADDLHLKGKNLVAVLFTDGDDTEAKIEADKMPRITKALEQFDKTGQQRPKVKTLGFGQCNEQTLALIGQATKTPFTYLQDLSHFGEVLVQDKTLSKNHRLVKFLYTIGEQTKQVSTLVHSDSLTIPNVYIPFVPGQATVVSVGDNKYSVKVNDPSLLPDMTYTDRLSILLSEIRELFLDQTVSSQERIAQLKTKRQVIATLTTTNDNQRVLQAFAFSEIDEYIGGLQNPTDQRTLTSLYSQAEMAQRATVTDVIDPASTTTAQVDSFITLQPKATSSTNSMLTQFLGRPITPSNNQALTAASPSAGQSKTQAPPTQITRFCTLEMAQQTFGGGTTIYDVVNGFHHYTHIRDGQEVGHAMLQGQKGFCYYPDGTNNLIKADGVFQNFVACLPDAKHAQTCQAPTDNTMTVGRGILSGMPVGVCSGVGQIVEKHLEQKQKGSPLTRTLANKATCYGLYYTWDFTSTVTLDHWNGTYVPWVSEGKAAVSAAVDTLYLGAADLASQALSKTFACLGRVAQSKAWPKTATACNRISEATPYLLLAPPAIQSGNPVAVIASAGSSALTRLATEAGVGAAVLKPKTS